MKLKVVSHEAISAADVLPPAGHLPPGVAAEKAELVLLHVDAQPDEPDAFVLQPEALFHARLAAQENLSARAHHPLPRQAARRMQRPRHLPRRAGKPGGVGDVAVGGDLAARDAPYLAQDALEHSRFHGAYVTITRLPSLAQRRRKWIVLAVVLPLALVLHIYLIWLGGAWRIFALVEAGFGVFVALLLRDLKRIG